MISDNINSTKVVQLIKIKNNFHNESVRMSHLRNKEMS